MRLFAVLVLCLVCVSHSAATGVSSVYLKIHDIHEKPVRNFDVGTSKGTLESLLGKVITDFKKEDTSSVLKTADLVVLDPTDSTHAPLAHTTPLQTIADKNLDVYKKCGVDPEYKCETTCSRGGGVVPGYDAPGVAQAVGCASGQKCCLTKVTQTARRSPGQGSKTSWKPLGFATKDCEKAWNKGEAAGKSKTPADWIVQDLTTRFDPWRLFADVNRAVADVSIGGAHAQRTDTDVAGWKTAFDRRMADARSTASPQKPVAATLKVKEENSHNVIDSSKATDGQLELWKQPFICYVTGLAFGFLAKAAEKDKAVASLVYMLPAAWDVMPGKAPGLNRQGRPTAPHMDNAYAQVKQTGSGKTAIDKSVEPFPPFYFVIAEDGPTFFLSGNNRKLVPTKWKPNARANFLGTSAEYWTTEMNQNGVRLKFSDHACDPKGAEGWPAFQTCYTDLFHCTEGAIDNNCQGEAMMYSWIGPGNGVLSQLATSSMLGEDFMPWNTAKGDDETTWRAWKPFLLSRWDMVFGGPIQSTLLASANTDATGMPQWAASAAAGDLAIMTGYQMHYGGWGSTSTSTRWFMRLAFSPDTLTDLASQPVHTDKALQKVSLLQLLRENPKGKKSGKQASRGPKQALKDMEAAVEANCTKTCVWHHMD